MRRKKFAISCTAHEVAMQLPLRTAFQGANTTACPGVRTATAGACFDVFAVTPAGGALARCDLDLRTDLVFGRGPGSMFLTVRDGEGRARTARDRTPSR